MSEASCFISPLEQKRPFNCKTDQLNYSISKSLCKNDGTERLSTRANGWKSRLCHCHSLPAGCVRWRITQLMSPQWVSRSLPRQASACRPSSVHRQSSSHLTAGGRGWGWGGGGGVRERERESEAVSSGTLMLLTTTQTFYYGVAFKNTCN